MKFIYILILCPLLSIAQINPEITGVWKSAANTWDANTKEFADCEIYKFITPTRWASIFIRPINGEVAGYGGGTYNQDGQEYIETLEYFSFDSTAVGSQQRFKKYRNGPQLIQEGMVLSEKYNYRLYSVYDKVDDLHDHRAAENFITGTWQIQKAHWGKNKRSADDLKSMYGEVIKIITPKYYHVAYFDKHKKTTGGAVFGTQKIRSSDYDESLIAWTWDPKTTGSKPVYSWEIKDGMYHQFGKLDAGEYQNYLIEEWYKRLEPLNIHERFPKNQHVLNPLKGNWLLVEGKYGENHIKNESGIQFKRFTDHDFSLIMESENDSRWARTGIGTYQVMEDSFSETFVQSSDKEYIGLTCFWNYKMVGEDLIVEGPTKIIDKHNNEATDFKHLLNTMWERRKQIVIMN